MGSQQWVIKKNINRSMPELASLWTERVPSWKLLDCAHLAAAMSAETPNLPRLECSDLRLMICAVDARRCSNANTNFLTQVSNPQVNRTSIHEIHPRAYPIHGEGFVRSFVRKSSYVRIEEEGRKAEALHQYLTFYVQSCLMI